ncbi:MAG TPA: SHOCT domain-containing protein [Solirubrobacterales bacterium]|nr:SHOCT domain-containing protein [Solirubrobacterales bacterium]
MIPALEIATGFGIPLADTWGMHGDDVGTGWMIVMVALMVLFWGAVILGIVLLTRGAFYGWRGDGQQGGRSETPTAILERRFAEGAISVEEYRARREVLGKKDAPTTEPPGAGG